MSGWDLNVSVTSLGSLLQCSATLDAKSPSSCCYFSGTSCVLVHGHICLVWLGVSGLVFVCLFEGFCWGFFVVDVWLGFFVYLFFENSSLDRAMQLVRVEASPWSGPWFTQGGWGLVLLFYIILQWYILTLYCSFIRYSSSVFFQLDTNLDSG